MKTIKKIEGRKVGGLKPSNVQERRKAGVYLKQCREVIGLTQREVAQKCNFEYYTFISQLEGGHGKLPSDKWEIYARTVDQDVTVFARRMLQYYEPVAYGLIFEKGVMSDG